MNRIINKLRNPMITTVLILSIVLIPILSSPFTEVHAEDVYQAYTKSGEYPASDHLKNPIYVRPDGSNAKGDVAYCFNDHRSFPDSAFSPRKTLYTKELGTAAKFEELADTERVNGESLYNGLVRVIYDGYPNNKSGIKERYGLTDGQFRQITQYAVWYYTDTFNMPARDTSGNNFTENEKNAFNDLVNSTTAIPAGTKLDIYRAKDNSYQNLLSGHFQPNTPTPTPTPTPTTKEIEFSKVKLGGTELAGAEIEIYKGTQKVSEWTSTTTSKKIQLEPGTYRFHEEAAPAGFLAVTDFTFTVKADGTVELGTIAQGETVVAASGKITVTDNAKPEPTTPGTTPKPGAKKPSIVVKSKSPKTGDEGNFAQYALLLMSSGIALSAIGYNRRKNVK
ncbi:thioester-forming surface-anchored protein [Mogibacterium sp.]